MTQRSRYDESVVYRTRDGSQIRELMHPRVHGNHAQSLAEATVAPGQRTLLHRHEHSEELYHIIAGQGWLTLGDTGFTVEAGDTVCIMPQTPHCIENTGQESLRILCCCAPAYAHADTVLLEPHGNESE
ncbi:MAG: hypothetical protein AMJ69_01630 [Gammaproteobacteria bacterium SG8_47]|nr:MAG: hypothetical protein AMJ69_01630 [Gammaproteobacteria bacterium SG8_47]